MGLPCNVELYKRGAGPCGFNEEAIYGFGKKCSFKTSVNVVCSILASNTIISEIHRERVKSPSANTPAFSHALRPFNVQIIYERIRHPL